MQGHIRKRGNDSWAVVIDLGADPLTGKRRRIWRSIKGNKRDAERLRVELLHARQGNGLHAAPGRLTVARYLETWLDGIATNVRPTTHQRYEQHIRLHVVPVLGDRALVKLTASDLQALYAAKLKEGLAPRTVRDIHLRIHKALGDAVRLGLLARNVADLVKPPRAPAQEMKALSPDEARTLLATAAEGDPLEALYVLAITTGMRRGEILGLKWCDVDLDASRLQVRRSVARVNGRGWVEQEPKSAHSRRSIALTPTAVAALRRHRQRQIEYRLSAIAWQDNDLCFANELGRFIEPQNLMARSFHPLLRRAGLPRIRFHDLRHTAASLLLAQGVHVKVVSEMLGHSQIALTLDTYSHVIPSLQEEAAASMEALLAATR